MPQIKIGLLGFGAVGAMVYEILERNGSSIAQKIKSRIEVAAVCVRNPDRDRGVSPKLFTKNFKDVVLNPDVKLVVELMGDCPEAYEAIKLALSKGRSVVTANKAILARHALELFQMARKNHCELLFEASVAGGIPVLRTVREGLAANHISSLHGIINGTANYILSRMTAEGADFDAVLKQAQEMGYAEANPASDVEGHDTAYKLCILIMLCHGKIISVDDIYCRGISYIKPIDLKMAQAFSYVIKLLGISRQHKDGLEARVHPTMISRTNPLAHVDGVFNAVQYHGDYVGEGMLLGLGAGGAPTASAVAADIMEVARNIQSQNKSPLEPAGFLTENLEAVKPRDILSLNTRYYIRFSVLDRPNVLAHITRVLGKHSISIQHLYQHGEEEEKAIPVIVFTHTANEKNIRAALKEIDHMDFITQITKIIRIEDNE